jgi:transcription-repair coupling factor (superfamily II helicase)
MSQQIQAERALAGMSYPIEELLEALEQRRDAEVVASNDTHIGVLLREIAERLERPLVLVTSSNRAARDIHQTIRQTRPANWPGRDMVMPGPDVSPYNDTSPDRNLALQRMELLAAAPSLSAGDVLVCPAMAWAMRCPPADAIRSLSLSFEVEEELDIGELRQTLLDGGYTPVGLVEDRGTFSIRGDVIDIFSPGDDEPVRVELYGDMVESIRRFDVQSQRSADSLLSYRFTPVQEIVLSDRSKQIARDRLTKLNERIRLPSSTVGAVVRDIQNDVRFFGIESLKPAFYKQLEPLSELLPEDAVVAVVEPEEALVELEEFIERRQSEFEREIADERVVFPPEEYFLTPEAWQQSLKQPAKVLHVRQLRSGGDASFEFPAESNSDVERTRKRINDPEERFDELAKLIHSWEDLYGRILFACSSRGQAGRLATLLRRHGIEAERSQERLDLSPTAPPCKDYRIHVTPLRTGFRSAARGIAVVTDGELLGRTRRAQSAQLAEESIAVSSFKDLDIGDLIVHIDFGIGRYLGLQHMDLGDGIDTEFLIIEYADEDKLYLPIYRLGRVQKYVGSSSFKRLDKLGGTSWERTKSRIKKQIEGIARELLKIYAERESKVGFAFSKPGEDFIEFEASFPYEETPHQQKAIDDVIADMTEPKPMDRLICGDVGFGKTEVAIRGAYKAVVDGKQVAVLVPTTVLADQHLHSFRSRLEDTPARVDMLSRFRSAKESRQVLEDVAEGKVDILIGTHRLLSKDIEFKDLGLLVVDEEQRFGVKHKEEIKRLRASIDVLTMTATPIPRTLEMSLLGIRDLSVILTPPAGRLAVRTHIAKFKDATIREGIQRELDRGGQVFFVHNRVETIHNFASEIQRIVPEARVIVAHAQMSARELEDIMHDFINRKYDVLVSTTIIESGIDITSANTIFINRADTFGLAQLYQLRGRVGRGSHRAYCYLLCNEPRRLSPDAKRRLEVLQQHTELGSGLQIAHHDLDMRGAGNLLGRDQSGHIESVGFELFSELLQETIEEMRGEEGEESYEPEVRVPIASFIPDDYVEDLKQRLLFYKRFSMADTPADVHEIYEELQDRYGRAPEAVDALKEIVLLKLSLRRMRAAKLEAAGSRVVVELREDTKLDPNAVTELIREFGGIYSFKSDMRIFRKLQGAEKNDLLAAAIRCVRELEECL